MVIIYYALYIVYLLVQMDSQLVNRYFSYTSYYLIFYCIALAVFLLMHILYNRKTKVLVNIPIQTFLMLGLLYLVQSFRSSSNDYEILMSWVTLFTVFLQYLIIENLQLRVGFLWISYFVPVFFLVKQCLVEQINFVYELQQVNFASLLFGTERYRSDFGFYNINLTGNLCAGIILVSFLLFWYAANEVNSAIKKISFIVLICGDFFLTVVLILADSRNAMFAVLITLVVMALLEVMKTDRIMSNQKLIMQGSLIVLMALIIIVFLIPQIMLNANSSGRSYALNVNIKVLDTLFKQIFGIGLVGSGAFGQRQIIGYATVALDGYYLYILITCGIIGLSWLAIILFRLGKSLYSKIQHSSIYIVVFGIFIGHMASGIGETCILYYSFVSSIILFTIYLIYSNDEDETIELNDSRYLNHS